jgi:short-subunit dehydrogenase
MDGKFGRAYVNAHATGMDPRNTEEMTMSTTETKGTAVVTGASSGIGAVYADRLARRGYDLILVARNKDRLAALARRIAGDTGRTVETVPADLTDAADLHRVEQILRTNAGISLLVNNAGVAAVTPLVASDVDKMEEMVQLNVTALTRLTYAAVPGFVARRSGTIINIASVVAITPESLNGVYGASKAYVLALTQSLQHELADTGVRVQAVLPGATATEIWDLAGKPLHELPQQIVMSPGDMVDASLATRRRASRCPASCRTRSRRPATTCASPSG